MDCYFCGVYNKLAKEGVGSFSIPKLGMLFRTVIDEKDEVLISFTSLFLLFEFVMLNPLLFKNASFLDFKGNAKILEYIGNEKNASKKVKSFMNTLTSLRMELHRMGIGIHFIKVPKSKNLSLLSIDTLKVNKELMLLFKNMQLEANK